MSHRARRSRAEAPDEAVELAAGEVRRAFEEWASRFVALVVRDLAPSVAKQRQDATVEGLYREVGRAKPRTEKLEQAFRMLDKQSADELRVAGVATADVIPKAEARKQEWLRANTDLIRAEAELRRRVERVIADPLNQGRSVADIAKLLEEQAGYSTSRATLTARDQTLKLYGQVQQERQQNAGVERYVWTTSLDERVRPDHADLDGTIQSWDDPPIVDKRTGRRGHPGFDFQCRCTAVAVLDEDDVANPEAQQRQTQLREKAIQEGRFAAPPPPPPRRPERQRPPREPAMSPTQAELDAARAQAEAQRRAEAARLQAEREADARIAAARAEQARAEAARLAAEADLRAAAEAKQRAAEAARVAEIERAAAVRARAPAGAAERAQTVTVAAERLGLTESELRGFMFEQRITPGARGTVSVEALRANPAWKAWYGRKAIERYTENSAFLVNRKLRTVGWDKSWAPAGSTATERRYYEGLKSIAREAADTMAAQATNARPLARGTAVPKALLERWQRDGAVSDPAFMSFSTDVGTARRFVPSENFTGQFAESGTERVLIRSRDGGGFHYGGPEEEVMFPPGTRLQITGVTREGDITVIDVRPPSALIPR